MRVCFDHGIQVHQLGSLLSQCHLEKFLGKGKYDLHKRAEFDTSARDVLKTQLQDSKTVLNVLHPRFEYEYNSFF